MDRDKTVRKILWVENDREFTDRLSKLLPGRLRPHSVELVVARHMEEARLLLKQGAEGLAVLIVDIMLPEDQTALEKSERLEEERREALHQILDARRAGGPNAEEEVRRLRYRVESRDAQIEACTDLEGGVKLVEEMAPQPVGIPTVFLTARGQPGLQERAQKCVAEQRFYWLQKPVEVNVIAGVLVKCLAL